jgi:hypothetical protein
LGIKNPHQNLQNILFPENIRLTWDVPPVKKKGSNSVEIISKFKKFVLKIFGNPTG